MNSIRIISILIVLLTAVANVRACDCVLSGVKEAVKRSDAVLVGTVLSVTKMEARSLDVLPYFQLYVRRTEIKVEQTFKGRMVSDTVVIYTEVEGVDCGIDFLRGQRYIVYGYRDNREYRSGRVTGPKPLYGRGVYWTNTCTRTRLFEEAEVKALEALD